MDLEIAIKGIVVTTTIRVCIRRTDKGVLSDVVYPKENRQRSSLRMLRIRRRTDEGVLLGWVMFVTFLLSRRLLLSRSMYHANPKDRRRSPLGCAMFVYFLFSRRLLLSRSMYVAYPKDRERSPFGCCSVSL